MRELFTITNFGYAITVLLMVGILLLLILQGRNKASRLLTLLVIGSAYWVICNLIADNSLNEDIVLLWSRLALIGPIFIGPIFHQFSKVFPNRERNFDFQQFITTLLTTIPFLLFINTDLNISNVEIKDFGVDYTPGVLYTLFTVYIVIFILLGVRNIFQNYTISSGLGKLQIRFVALGFLSTFTIAIISSAILPLMGISQLAFLAPISTTIFLGATTYSVVRHRLFGITFILGQLTYGILISIFPIVTFYIAYYVQIKLWGTIFSTEAILFGVVISGVFSFTFLQIEQITRQFVSSRVINTKYDPEKTREDYQKKISNTIDLVEIISEFQKLLKSTLNLQLRGLYWFENDKFKSLTTANEEKLTFTDDISTIAEAKKLLSEDLTLYQELSLKDLPSETESRILDFMRKNNLILIYKYSPETNNEGICFIGYEEQEVTLNYEDILFVISAIQNTYLSTDRALLYSEVQQFNKTLQEKVDKATEELQKQYEILQGIRNKERDMMDIMGHELRTPLSIIKISLGALDLKAKKDPRSFTYEAYQEYAERIKDALKREVELLETMLSSTKIDAKKVEMHLEQVDLIKVIDDAILSQKENYERKELRVNFAKPDQPVSVFADKIRLAEVVDNLVGNAVKYTQEGKIDIDIDQTDPKMAKVLIADTGPGIPADALPHLGEKFYRVKQYVSPREGSKSDIVRPGGTGLGLYVTFGLVELMGGTYKVESEVGKGSTFSFTVPKFTGQSEVENSKGSKNLFSRMGLKDEQS